MRSATTAKDAGSTDHGTLARLLVVVLKASGWPAAVIALCATAWWFLPPIKTASSEPAAAADAKMVERLGALDAKVATLANDVATIKENQAGQKATLESLKDGVGEIRAVLLRPR